MKKFVFTSLFLTISYISSAQVGVGTTNPQGAFEVVSTTDGLLVPRVALTNTTTATILTPTKSEMIYNTATAGDVTPGYYYWETTPTVASDRWVRFAAAAPSNDWGVTGNALTNPATNFAGTTDPQDFAIRTTNTERARITATGSMGIGTTAPNGALDINSTTQGMVPPRVALTATNVALPVINPAGGGLVAGTLVWNTGTSLPAVPVGDRVAPGMYYWNGTRWISLAGSPGGLDWSIIGNGGIDGGITGTTTPLVAATQGTHFIGTYDPTNMDVRTNGLHAARISQYGEFFIGGLETVLPGDLMNGISEGNVLFPWAVNGYTDQNGAGVYGSVTGGTTNFAAVQGEYTGTGTSSSGVRGINFLQGTNGFSFASPIRGTDGSMTTDGLAGTWFNGNNIFGVYGSTGDNQGITSGGVVGINPRRGVYAMLGYQSSGGASFAARGNANYSNGAFRTTENINLANANVGLSILGGYIGGHLKGEQYGLISKGKRFGIYSDGSVITNKNLAVINKTKSGEKEVTYATTSQTIDITTKGSAKLQNGEAFISFDENYRNTISDKKPIIVTVSPMGESNGVYVSKVSKEGFTIKENNNGISNVSFYWIAIAEKDNNNEVPNELLANDFEENLDSYLSFDERAAEKGTEFKSMWWNGNTLEFGKVAPDTFGNEIEVPSFGRFNPNTKRVIKENLRKAQINEIMKAKAEVKK